MAFRHLPGTLETMLGFLYVPPHSCFHEPESHKPKNNSQRKTWLFSLKVSQLLQVQKVMEFSVSHSVTLETQLSLLLRVCVFQWFGEGAQ